MIEDHADYCYLHSMKLAGQSYVVYLIWAVLGLELVLSLINARYSLAFVALATIALSLAPVIFADRFDIQLPVHFFAGIVCSSLARVFGESCWADLDP